jgi:hypothetical protein
LKRQLILGWPGELKRGLFPENLPRRVIRRFPLLQNEGARKTSKRTKQYNCLSWSSKRVKKQWFEPLALEPWYHCPPELRYGDYSIENFFQMFENLGYERIQQDDDKFEFCYKKVAIYGILGYYEIDKWGFAHVSDQLHTGKWTSKLGDDIDIRHYSLKSLEGDTEEYGKVIGMFRKKCNFGELVIRLFLKLNPFF